MNGLLKNIPEGYLFNVLILFALDIIILLFVLGTAYYIDLNRHDLEFKKNVPFLITLCFVVVMFVVAVNAGIFLNL